MGGVRNSEPSEELMHPLHRSEASILSPLRYPGAKRRLSGYIAECLRLNGLRPRLFVEPFAGGASVSLQLLNDDLVERVALGERDQLVASFWKVVFFDHEWLLDKIARLRPTLTKWKQYRADPGDTDRERALACLFLNRTSFSGILAPGAGPIGGQRQRSSHKLDCRFAAKTVCKRITQAAALRDRVEFVSSSSWKRTLARARARGYREDEIMFYFDPPFYNKAERLYTHFFHHKDHVALHEAVMALKAPWLVSYDLAPAIIQLYSDNGRKPRSIELLYSLRAADNQAKVRELIIANLPRLPSRTRLWRTSKEWLAAGRDAN